jgi:hypothetical protein
MVLLSKLIDELRDNIDHNKDLLKMILKKNPNMVYQKINEISLITGSRYYIFLIQKKFLILNLTEKKI